RGLSYELPAAEFCMLGGAGALFDWPITEREDSQLPNEDFPSARLQIFTSFTRFMLVKNALSVPDTRLKRVSDSSLVFSSSLYILHLHSANCPFFIMCVHVRVCLQDFASAWDGIEAEFHGIWESLVYETGVKTKLLDYVTTTMYFSDKNVNSNLISWNRVVLLHGPPGTGKTSLCKALAQKLSIRLSSRYSYGQFVEINSHSLFSKWFSESGKLVTKMFQKIQQLIDDKDALVFVLIDEVESLTAARNASQAGTEPSDAIRVVNSVLTQLDQIKRHSNVVILTTSNVTEKIDLAFVDRADIKQYIGPPSEKGIYNIYLSCLEELMKCQIIYPRQQLFTMHELETMDFSKSEVSEYSLKLRNIAIKSKGLSGRALRKLPFLAHALFVKMPTVSLEMFLEALSHAVDEQGKEKDNLINGI
ncbi:pachytene checkpoint protein 2-like protein, partial [Nothobranchius furzeri]